MSQTENGAGEYYWKMIEPIWNYISIYDGTLVFLNQFQSVRRELGILLAAHWCYSEVCNGGFHQFFSNPTGVLAPEAVEGFQAIGLEDCADVIKEAMEYFGKPYPRDEEERNKLMESKAGSTEEGWNPFIKLDERFYDQLQLPESRFDRSADEYARRIAA